MSGGFEILSHPADWRLRIFGSSQKELFRQAVLAMFQSIEPRGQGALISERPILISSPDQNALLVDLLSEALSLSDIFQETYDDLQIDKLADTTLQGRLIGHSVKSFTREIKSVTHHRLEIKQKNDQWEVEVIFDI